MLNSDCDMVFLYNINSRLDVLIDRSWKVGDLVAKGFWDGSETLDHFGGQVKGLDF